MTIGQRMSTLNYSILVDLDVFKALTARIGVDGQTSNDVLRELLYLDSPLEHEPPEAMYSAVSDALAKHVYPRTFYSRGLMLPDGTKLRARYKGNEYQAVITDGQWITEDGAAHESPSAAANHITSTVVNGLRFWEGQRPGDRGFRRLDAIRDSVRK